MGTCSVLVKVSAVRLAAELDSEGVGCDVGNRVGYCAGEGVG